MQILVAKHLHKRIPSCYGWTDYSDRYRTSWTRGA